MEGACYRGMNRCGLRLSSGRGPARCREFAGHDSSPAMVCSGAINFEFRGDPDAWVCSRAGPIWGKPGLIHQCPVPASPGHCAGPQRYLVVENALRNGLSAALLRCCGGWFLDRALRMAWPVAPGAVAADDSGDDASWRHDRNSQQPRRRPGPKVKRSGPFDGVLRIAVMTAARSDIAALKALMTYGKHHWISSAAGLRSGLHHGGQYRA